MRPIACSVVLLAFSFGGCEHKDKSEPPLTPAARTAPAAERAIGAFAAARCDHQERCNAIGTSGPYQNRDACMNVMLSDGYQELSGCRAGIQPDDIEDCLEEIWDSECNVSLTRLDAVADCRMEDLCFD